MKLVSPAFTLTAALLAASSLAQEPTEAPTPVVTAGATSAYESRYIWNGLVNSDGPVQQSSLWVASRSVTFTVWNNTDLGRKHSGQTDEVDYALSTSHEWAGFTLEPSINWWTYPSQVDAPATGVLSIALSKPVGRFTVRTLHTLDVKQYGGAYYGEIGVSHRWEPGTGAGVEASINIGAANGKFNETYVGPRIGAANQITLGLSIDWVSGGYTIQPHLGWTSLLNSSLRDASETPTIGTFGITLSRDW